MPTQPFDLTAALAGAKVVRRDGTDEVIEVVEFKNLPDDDLPVRVLFRRPDGAVYSGKRYRNGARKRNASSRGDLLMGQPAAKYVNLSRDGTWDMLESETDARNAARNSDEYTFTAIRLPD